jgi:uncharacterized lipoprotein YajG
MKIIYSLLPIFFLTACANNTAEKKATSETKLNGQNTASETPTAERSASIKILKNGKQVAEYTPSGPAATILKMSGNESMMINLNSADNVYSTTGILKTPASGNYKPDGDVNSDTQIQFLSDGSTKLPTMMNLKGNLQITITGETCSGTFSGTDKVMNEYEVSGSFTNIPLEKR